MPYPGHSNRPVLVIYLVHHAILANPGAVQTVMALQFAYAMWARVLTERVNHSGDARLHIARQSMQFSDCRGYQVNAIGIQS
jgi:hypothetical protein